MIGRINQIPLCNGSSAAWNAGLLDCCPPCLWLFGVYGNIEMTNYGMRKKYQQKGISEETCSIGIAAVVRDSNGEFVVWRMVKYQGFFEVREAETKRLLDAITWTASLDLQHAIFETDSKSVVEVIYSNSVDRSEFGKIVGECCSLMSKERHYDVQFARRQTTMVAHNLARAVNFHASPCVLYDAPSFI